MRIIFLSIIIPILLSSCQPKDIEIEQLNISFVPITKTIEIEILERINAHRINLGLTTLNNHNTIKAVAYTHTDYMVEVDNVSHDNFIRRRNSLIDNASAIAVAENVAYAYSSAESVVNAWLNSKGHRGTIEGDFTDFDISAEQNEDGRWYFTNIFIKTLN